MLQLLESIGLELSDLLKEAKLADDLFTRENASFTAQEYFRFWDIVETTLNNPPFNIASVPLYVIQAMKGRSFSPPVFAALCCENFAQALRRLNEFKPLIGPLRLHFDEQADHTIVYPALLDVVYELPASLALAELLFVSLIARTGSGNMITPIKVIFPRAIAHPEAYADFFGIAPELGDELSISFSKQDLERSFVDSNKALLETQAADLRQRLAELKTASGFASTVRSVLIELLPAGISTMAVVASRLAVSTRTLQRRLQQENTNFQNELGKTRIGLAKYYLSQTSLPNQQIGFLLGFTEANSFYRLFQSTAKMTPETFRQSK